MASSPRKRRLSLKARQALELLAVDQRGLPRRRAVTAAAIRDHSAEPRSRLVNISSHVGSMRIGVPHIRIEDGSRVWGGTVS